MVFFYVPKGLICKITLRILSIIENAYWGVSLHTGIRTEKMAKVILIKIYNIDDNFRYDGS